MTRKEREQIKELAKMLFVHETLSQKEVSKRIGVSETTISKWSRADNWEQLRVSITITKEEQLRNLYRQLAAINDVIANRDVKYASPGEADTISKIATSIEKMESDIGVADIISVAKKFTNWLRKFDIDSARDVTALFDGFIKENLR